MPWILFPEPNTKRSHSVRIRTDTTLDQDCAEDNCAGMCSVHDRVIVDNMYEFQRKKVNILSSRSQTERQNLWEETMNS